VAFASVYNCKIRDIVGVFDPGYAVLDVGDKTTIDMDQIQDSTLPFGPFFRGADPEALSGGLRETSVGLSHVQTTAAAGGMMTYEKFVATHSNPEYPIVWTLRVIGIDRPSATRASKVDVIYEAERTREGIYGSYTFSCTIAAPTPAP